MIPIAAFALGFGVGFVRAARAGRAMPDRLHRGVVMGLALTLLSLFLGLIGEAVMAA